MTDLPSQFGFGLVTGGFALAVGDRDDPGRNPDALPATGSVLFRPQASRIVIPGERVITPQQIECKLDAAGYLYLPESVEPDPETGLVAEEDRGVYLVANDTTDATPQDWTYEVTVSLTGQSQWRFPIAVTTGSVQDISALVPVDSSGGTPIIRGPQGEPGADGIMASIVAGDGITVDDTDPANPVVAAVPEITTDTSVGTRVFAGGQMIYGDTGWRDVSGDLLNDWTAASVSIARRGSDVILSVDGLTGSVSTLINLPSGFRGRSSRSDLLVPREQGVSNAAPGKVYPGSNGAVWVSTMTGAQFTCRWATDDPWPTTLPGVEA